jgi:HK97 family phage prohead protease
MNVKFANGASGCLRSTEVEVLVPREAGVTGAVLDFVASDATCDRYQEVIEPSGWELANYRRNPVFLNAHEGGDVGAVIGRALWTKVVHGKLVQRIEFAVNANPLAKVAYDLYTGGFLRAVSVGFIPLLWEDGKPEDPWRRRYLKQELVEVSAVGVPANPNALMKPVKGCSELLELAKIFRAAS